MTANAIVSGVFADLKTVRTRSIVQMVIEIPVERAEEVVQMFGFPQPGAEVPVAVARLMQPAAPKVEQPAGKKSWDELSYAQQAGIACGEPEFWQWLTGSRHAARVHDAESAAQEVRYRVRVQSRAEFDKDEAAAERWRTIYGEYKRWRAEQIGQAQAEAQALAYGRGR